MVSPVRGGGQPQRGSQGGPGGAEGRGRNKGGPGGTEGRGRPQGGPHGPESRGGPEGQGGRPGGDRSEGAKTNKPGGRGGDFQSPQGALDPKVNFEVNQGRRGGGRFGGGQKGGPSGGGRPTGGDKPAGAGAAGGSAPTGGNAPANGNAPTGGNAPIDMEKAAGGDPEILAALQKVASSPKGSEALQIALDKGTTFHRGELEGNTAGLTTWSGDSTTITLERLETDVVAHEIFHAAYPDMDHEAVYQAGRDVATSLGEKPIT